MKIIFGFKLFLFCLILNPFFLFARDNYQELFLNANKLYKEGDFQKSFDLYKKISEGRPLVNYNLGNCAYKLGKFGYAMLYWKRSEKSWGFFKRKELLENIELLKKEIVGKKEDNKIIKYSNFLKNYLISLLYSAPLFPVQILFLLLWLISFLYLRYLYRRKRKILIFIIFIFIAFLGSLLVLRYNLDFKHYGIVINKKGILFSGPGENFQKLGILPETSQVRINKISDNFYKVKMGKLVGWINIKNVEKI